MVKENLLEINNSLISNFSELLFEEKEHRYTVSGIVYPSVSSLIKSFYEEFNFEFEAKKYSLKHNFELEDVEGGWNGESDYASSKGTRVHNFAEDYAKWKYFGIGQKPIATCKQCLAVIQFWNDLPSYLIPVAFELQMYHKEYGYCGTADIVLYNLNTDTFVIADWKTNKDLFGDERYKKLLLNINPSYELYQNNFGKYTLQFSFYQVLLEAIGIKVSSRMLIWLQPSSDDKLYTTYRTKDLSKELIKWLEDGGAKKIQPLC